MESVPLNKIIINTDFNSRQSYKDLSQLAKNIQEHGQITPVVVHEVGTKRQPFTLVAGFRRFQAMKKAGFKTINIVKTEGEKTEAQLFAINLAENVARHQLTSYEAAKSIARLVDEYDYTRKEAAAELASGRGMSYSHVTNLYSAYHKLDPIILAAWMDGHPAATTARLFSIRKMLPEDQLEAWEAAKEAKDAPEEDMDGMDRINTKHDGPKRLSEKKLQATIEYMEENLSESEVVTAVKSALAFALGTTSVIEGKSTVYFDQEAILEAAKEAKAVAKAEAKAEKDEAKAEAKAAKDEAKAEAQAEE